ncbi:Serine threonine- kinase [Brachionus plicatilis]|uniref:Serine threonine-kinase n=1 Tax=Brachionus plicatilis TaxID=10195 RepID=A0A3M7PPC0_BRAPC|nr:Serine threonine- kinase [Brachionus plicatilis]
MSLKKKVSDKHIYGKHPMIVCNDKEIDLDYRKIKIWENWEDVDLVLCIKQSTIISDRIYTKWIPNRHVAFGMICGIKRIHAYGFFHKDIKPDNVLITNDFNAKIADFGTAKIIMDNETKFTASATYSYTPPEFYKFLSGDTKPNLNDLQRIDIFSLGLTLVEIFKGTHGRKDSKIGPIVIKIPPEYFQELINVANKFKNLNSYDIDEKFQIIDESCILFQRDFTIKENKFIKKLVKPPRVRADSLSSNLYPFSSLPKVPKLHRFFSPMHSGVTLPPPNGSY